VQGFEQVDGPRVPPGEGPPQLAGLKEDDVHRGTLYTITGRIWAQFLRYFRKSVDKTALMCIKYMEIVYGGI
jgi:hypothetical protein